jgi:hypothetical protein
MTLAYFTGAEIFTFDAAATSRAFGAGDISSSFFTTASGTVKVIYEYREVSSPSHVALLGFGILVLAGFRRVAK